MKDIQELYNIKTFDYDCTYGKGMFYQNRIKEPSRKSDLFPVKKDVQKAKANNLKINTETLNSLIFDPPFIVGHKKKKTGVIANKYYSFFNIKELWGWYKECIKEHYRVLRKNGIYVVKCQDTISGGKQWISHVFFINEAKRNGFEVQDIFILLAKSRIIGHNHQKQKHARKFNSYFIVFQKK